MQIEQALYGECSGGHSHLASSGDDAVSTAIVQRLDLPDTAPANVEWSPFLRGFPYQDRYVLARTFLDRAASRGGMVFSHALLAPLDELAETPDLRPLLKLLATSAELRPDAITVRLPCTEAVIPEAIDLLDAAEALGATGRLPIVRLGHVGFDDLVVALWAHLPAEIRRGFAFRLSFGPRDLVEEPMPALVCTPRAMAAGWSEYTVIQSDTFHAPSSLAAAILSGHENATPLIEFMQQIDVSPATFPDLRLAEQAYLLHIVRRPQFSWTRIKGESDVKGGGGHGWVEASAGSWVGADGGSPEGDRSQRRRRGGWVGGLGARPAVERKPETGRGVAAAARRVA